MSEFTSIHDESVLGVLSMFDRLIFKGHLLDFFPKGAFKRFLSKQRVLLLDYKDYVTKTTEKVRSHVEEIAQETGRPVIYLPSSSTHSSGQSKDDIARAIAERDGIDEGLVCILKVLENCKTFKLNKNEDTGKLELIPKSSKCLYYYLYTIDNEFGWMHIRIQTWFPFEIQVYINGREWLSRQLDKAGIHYVRYENCFLQIADVERAQRMCDRFVKKKNLVRVLKSIALRINPILPKIRRAGFRSYYWVTHQCEYATDIMFKDRASLVEIFPDLIRHSSQNFSAEDVLMFLGRKLHGNFKGEVTTDLKKRQQGYRVKHRMKGNSIKMYDKLSVLRVETTINNPGEFKILKVEQTAEGTTPPRWVPMAKRVANLWRYADVSMKANERYLNALAHVEAKGKVVKELDDLCRSRTVGERRYAKFNPVASTDVEVFKAVMAGDHTINGFRNCDVVRRLFPKQAADPEERRRRSARVSRLIAKLRGHRLISKVRDSRLYRVTDHGYRVMLAVLRFRETEFPAVYQQA